MKTEKADKSRHTVWLSDEAWNQVNLHYREDNCTFQNEYIEKAILFYSGYLDAQNASAYLPQSSPMSWKASWMRWAAGWADCCSSWQWNKI